LREALEKYRELFERSRDGSVGRELLEKLEKELEDADLPYIVRKIPQALQRSQEGIDRVNRIVRSMREFAHPGTGKKVLVNLNKTIESATTVSRNEWKYVADVELDFDKSLPQVPCLPGEFSQVIVNLVVNAAHAIADVVGDGANEKGSIAITTRQDGDRAEVRISDTGGGIPAAVREHIFDPFFTTKEVGRGTGQGLAISHDVVVNKLGGTITFTSVEGKGTTFVIRLPMEYDPDEIDQEDKQ
jgi:signal transduction histidine kinase